MILGAIDLTQHFDYVMLLFIRVSGILISSPIFGRQNIPRMAKIGFCLVLTSVFIVALPAPTTYPHYANVFAYGLTCTLELSFGVCLGFVMTAMFNVTMTAGAIIDMQTGFSMASIYDPQENVQTPITGNLYNIVLLILFFAVDGHLKIIQILYSTIQTVPIGMVTVPAAIAKVAMEVMSLSFMLSVMVAMPMIAAGLLLEFAMGAIIRTVPQMNMFVVGVPLKLILGLIVLISTFTVFAGFSTTIFDRLFEYVGIMFDSLKVAT
jgi:flagellar biosynthetic protein FliR